MQLKMSYKSITLAIIFVRATWLLKAQAKIIVISTSDLFVSDLLYDKWILRFADKKHD